MTVHFDKLTDTVTTGDYAGLTLSEVTTELLKKGWYVLDVFDGFVVYGTHEDYREVYQ